MVSHKIIQGKATQHTIGVKILLQKEIKALLLA